MRVGRLLAVLAGLLISLATMPVAEAQPKSVQTRLGELEKEVAELRELAVQVPTVAESAVALTARLAAIEEKLAVLSREQKSIPDAVERLDETDGKLVTLEGEVAELRTHIAGIEQPAWGGGGGVAYDKGFVLATSGGRFKLVIGGYMQGRFGLELDEDASVDDAGFRIRRARLAFKGNVLSEALTYKVVTEWAGGTKLLDYFGDYEVMPELRIRFGQHKVPFARHFLNSGSSIAFPEHALAFERLRYDRDVGVTVHGAALGGRIVYYGALTNGAGKNQVNDNRDLLVTARVEGAVLGKRIGYSFGDVKGTPTPSLTVGAGAAHDLAPMPATVAGIEVGNRDVDADGEIDNVRILSSSVDAIFRYQGLELAAEGIWRHERWGTILDHMDNTDLADAVLPSAKGRRNYLSGIFHATYFAIPHELMVGARLSHSRQPLLGLGGRSISAVPRADRLLELDGLVQLYSSGGKRLLGLQYSFLNYNAKNGPEPEFDKEHRVLLEAQLVL